MKRTSLLFLGLFVPGFVALILLTGEFGGDDSDLETRPPTTVKTTSSSTDGPGQPSSVDPNEIVNIAGRLRVVSPEVTDFVFPVHEEYPRPDGRIYAKTGELRGRRLNFKAGGNLIHVADPVLLLYEKLDPEALDQTGGDPRNSEPILVLRAHAKRGILNEPQNTLDLEGEVVVHHLEQNRVSASLETDALFCNLREQNLSTDLPVVMERILTPGSPDPGTAIDRDTAEDHPQDGSLTIRGRGLRARLLDGVFIIPEAPVVTYLASNASAPVVMRAVGTLSFRELETASGEAPSKPGNSGGADTEDGKVFVPRGEITLEKQVVIDLPMAQEEGAPPALARIHAGRLRLMIENLHSEDPADSGRVGQAIRNVHAEDDVRVVSDSFSSKSDRLTLKRFDDGRIELASFGSPQMILREGSPGETDRSSPPLLGNRNLGGEDPVILLISTDELTIRGREKDGVPAADGRPLSGGVEFERIYLKGDSRILRLGSPPTKRELAALRTGASDESEERLGVEGNTILVHLRSSPDRSPTLDRIRAEGQARFYDQKTVVWGERITAETVADGDETTSALGLGPVLIEKKAGLKTTIRSQSLLEASRGGMAGSSEEGFGENPATEQSILEVTCSDRISYRPALPGEKLHEAVFLGDVFAIRSPADPEATSPAFREELETDKLTLHFERKTTEGDDSPSDSDSKFEVRWIEAEGQFSLETPTRKAMGHHFTGVPEPPSFELTGEPGHYQERDETGKLLRDLSADSMSYVSSEDRFEARGKVKAFFVLEGRPSDHPEDDESPLGDPSAVEVTADDVVVRFSPEETESTSSTDPESLNRDPEPEFPLARENRSRVETLDARGSVEILRWDDSNRSGEPLRMVGDRIDYNDRDQSLVAVGTSESPAGLLRASDSNPDLVNEVRGELIRFFKGNEKKPDRVEIPEHGLVKIYSGAGESFYRTDRMNPVSESVDNGAPTVLAPKDSAPGSSSKEADENDEPALTVVRCKGPMTLVRGRLIRFEQNVVIKRYQPLGTLQAETECDLLTIYLEPPQGAGDLPKKDHALVDSVSKVIALGSVEFSGNDRQGSCNRLTWVPGQNSVELKGGEEPARLRIRTKSGRVLTRKARSIEYNFETNHLRSFEIETRYRAGQAERRGRKR